MTRDPYPTWHRALYADAPTDPRPGRATRAWRRLRALLRRPGRNVR